MFKSKFSLATLAVGSILTLLGPAVASARDRNDDHRQGYDSRYDSRYDSHDRDRDFRLRQQAERERLEHRNRPNVSFSNGYNNPRIVVNGYVNGYRNSNGYYDNAGCWHQY